ncbi:hypothetical protein A2313_00620 [Candidatus Roizmanbacteria bacterium RIFOXYB2_FULL_41_10]|uniref:DUF288 domain-containing protein n=1 Tax=Candidatus Roizmanbacteria bacterium RIFOXYA1_FULL_41_12 TaxID=1802082 RepID=A0A1F7KAH7_9BACT|nr:MAG: hypothetical protein A2209_04100 [Candidatus Roizmanbacteria bacterium RIFOXYA1_FULL_41_12]OGK66883.1 MAG: hypothetical protein A2377_03225 [Candidatus Roizmanbacteria bacterium RIFOXYB1_FULL_41_27]OGK70743.1 MAG: hypothetical protein A2403_01480 [Candidatus Roizmanbacteria bacterium RIFOXYC1_FULL_41_16]OGK71464.1 MAG: hypothetical protein A2313_00620 [Candidatus Roizmanbacteria bacterium RIFOXYB2_FULL_41_10]OGK75677.1 MAG: hypothetical protein A2575_03215 [Candidatus Roizmanbacteria ba
MIPIVITSINSPTQAVVEFSRLRNFKLIVVGDQKTPSKYNDQNLEFISLTKQRQSFPTFSKLLPINSYSRKNLGYLWAWKNYSSDWLFETDDDNLPYANLTLPKFKQAYSTVNSDKIFFNIFTLFTREKAWPRGFPLDLIRDKMDFNMSIEKAKPLLIQSLIDHDSDFDAVYRLTINRPIKFKKNQFVAVSAGIYGQVNSQATWWHRNISALMYFPSTLSWRAADIWRGYVAQKIIWQLSGRLLYLSPQVYQQRLRHQVMADFQAEIPLYLYSQKLVEDLQKLKLSGNINQMLVQVYSLLVKQGFVDKHELVILKQWLKEINNLRL